MPKMIFSTLCVLIATTATVSAHGIVSGIVADGKYYSGYSPDFQWQNPAPVVAGWSIPQDTSRGFISDYSSPDIICHLGATPGQSYVKVAAGHTLELQWTNWPDSHHGPMLDYLANCNGECTKVNKETLLFNKIDQTGLVENGQPGVWGSDRMIANNNSWVVTIPSSIAPGKYVLRHETIALHSAATANGAQNYPQCINLEVTGSGTNSLKSGTLGTKLYKSTDPGILIDIWWPPMSSYPIPGPSLFNAVANNPQSTSTTTTGTRSSSSSSASKTPNPASISNSMTTSTRTRTTTTTISSPSLVVPTNTNKSSLSSTVPTQPTNSSSVRPTNNTNQPPTQTNQSPPTSQALFTGTFTGPLNQPTKFVCFAVDDNGNFIR